MTRPVKLNPATGLPRRLPASFPAGDLRQLSFQRATPAVRIVSGAGVSVRRLLSASSSLLNGQEMDAGRGSASGERWSPNFARRESPFRTQQLLI